MEKKERQPATDVAAGAPHNAPHDRASSSSVPTGTTSKAVGSPFDLLVIGGGVNGAGIARDAALRGLKVCLVEKEDWGSGTSAKSSKLAHGGLRYLEQFELGLVHEALQDREIMFRHAPHLVRPLRFLYPIYPHIAAKRVVRVGLWMYDLLSHGKSVPGRDYLSREAVLAEVPGLNPDGLKGAAVYYDGQIQHVERLVAELVWDAKQHGARCLNHTRVTGLIVQPNATPGGEESGMASRRVAGAEVEHMDGTQETMHARAVVNAAGAWVDDVLGALADGKPPKVRKTKGIHIVVPRFTETAFIIRSAEDGRTFFVLPWQGRCVVGTTDTDYVGDAGDAQATAEEVRYLQESARRYFPDAPLEEVEYTYAGVRALVNQEGLTESNVTRRHILYDHEEKEGVHGLWSLQGGKITTYRSLAEETIDQVCRVLGRNDLAKRHPTREGTLPGGPAVPWEAYREKAVKQAVAKYGVPQASAAHIVGLYGARWRAVLETDPRPDALDPIDPALPDLWCQVAYAVQQEDARTVADVMLRRTMMGLAENGRTQVAEMVALRMASLLGWDKAQQVEQMAAYRVDVSVFAVPE